MSPPLVIAVDGPAASGKGTIASGLAALYGLPHLDTGLLYRAVGVAVLAAGGRLDDEAGAAKIAASLDLANLDLPEYRTREAGEAASQVAVHPAVRLALLKMQQDFARRPGGAVIDGRDIGTVIAPDAVAKLFVTASAEVRAERRWKQLTGQGESVSMAEVLEDIRLRDARDSGRGAAPLTQADDAVLLDTSQESIESAADAARRIVEAARIRSNGSCPRWFAACPPRCGCLPQPRWPRTSCPTDSPAWKGRPPCAMPVTPLRPVSLPGPRRSASRRVDSAPNCLS